MLPNDPLVRELKPIQVDWMNFHLQREAEAMADRKGKSFTIESASDVPHQMLNGVAEGRPAGKFLGQEG